MDRKSFWIRQAVSHIREQDKNMDYQSKALREQALAFFNHFMTEEQLALSVARSLKQ